MAGRPATQQRKSDAASPTIKSTVPKRKVNVSIDTASIAKSGGKAKLQHGLTVTLSPVRKLNQVTF